MQGKTINGYKIEEFLGSGQFGEVYRATKSGESFAIKFIRTSFIFPNYLDRVEREIEALQRVSHKNTIKYIEDGFYKDNNTDYRIVVTEFIQGKTLRKIINDQKDVFEESRALEIIDQIIDGLSAIHEANVIHRDLKPANVMITTAGEIKILDYGLSKIIDFSSITQKGDRLGSYCYMSPEQIKGEKPIRPASDLYSIGVLLFELLTGEILFISGNDAEIIYKTINVRPPFPSSINSKITNHLDNIILKLLEKDAYKRFHTAKELYNELHRAIDLSKTTAAEGVIKFYPRLIQMDTKIVTTYLKNNELDGANFPINLHKQYNTITDALRKSGSKMDYFADPSTNRLTFSSFVNTKGLVELPFAPSGYDPLDIEDFTTDTQRKTFVESVIELQISNGVTVLTAPYFYFDNIGDPWFDINLKLLKESIDYVKQKYPQYQIAGAICSQAETLCRKTDREKIIDAYSHCVMDFCLFYIDSIAETTNASQLYNFIHTALSIKQHGNTKVVACRVPAIAQGLLTIGFDAITSGLGVLESFTKGVIAKEDETARMPTKFYMPALLSSISMATNQQKYLDILAQEDILIEQYPEDSFKITCSCMGCLDKTSNLSANFQLPRLHFLHVRNTEIKELSLLPVEDRKNAFFERIDLAYKLQNALIARGVKLSPSPTYLLTWKEILNKF